MRYLFVLAILFITSTMPLRASDDTEAASATLTAFHAAAADADWETYFDLLAEDSIFLGTDAGERWDKATFQAYAAPTKGWVYTMTERHVDMTPDGNTAWFDELLTNAKYGVTRGTGLLIRTKDGWKILQYNLTFPVPNDIAAGITQQIQVFEQQQKMGQN